MKLKINRFWSDDVKQAIKNEDYLLNRYCLIPKYNYIINQYNYLFNIFIDNSRFVPNLGVIGQFTSREITITVSKDMFTNIAQTIAPNEGDTSSEPVQPLNDELIGTTEEPLLIIGLDLLSSVNTSITSPAIILLFGT